MKVNCNPIRGTFDYSPKEMIVREKVRNIILECYKKSGFMQIQTPILENLSLLSSSDGGENLRMMFKTIRRGEKLDLSKQDLTEQDITEEGLRYDLTVPLARFYSNNKEKLPTPFKSIQIDEAFRAERPQKGRKRQFTQADADILGDASENAEIEVLWTAISAYKALGFKGLILKINSREVVNELVYFAGFNSDELGSVLTSLDKLDKIGADGVRSEMLEKGLNEQNVEKLTNALSKISENGIDEVDNFGVSAQAKGKLAKIISSVKKFSGDCVDVKFDVSVVRGQGYYTGTVFEFFDSSFNRAIGGGGRYDKMIEKLLGVSIPAVGISIGFEPTVMLMQEKGLLNVEEKSVAVLYSENFEKAFEVKCKLIDEGYNASLYKKPKNVFNLLTKLKDNGYEYYADCDKTAEVQKIN